MDSSTKNENSVIMTLFLWNIKEDILSLFLFFWLIYRNFLVTNILQNVLVYVPQTKESHTRFGMT